MKKLLWFLLAMALAGLGFWGAERFFLGDQARIRRLLPRLADTVSIERDAGNIARMAKIHRLAAMVSPEVLVHIENSGADSIASREDLIQSMTAAQRFIQQLKVKFLHQEIRLAADQRSATVLAVVLAELNAEPNSFLQEIKFTLQKPEKHWLISKIETVKKL